MPHAAFPDLRIVVDHVIAEFNRAVVTLDDTLHPSRCVATHPIEWQAGSVHCHRYPS